MVAMGELSGDQLTVFLLGLAVLLAAAHLLGEAARRLGQPVVIGEMVAGLLLGPTFFGWLAPNTQSWLFPHEGAAAIALDGIVMLAVTMLLLLAGMEVDLSTVRRQGKAVVFISTLAVLIPLAVGGLVAWLSPAYWGMPTKGDPQTFALFFGTALAVSALPVIAKILLDLDLFQSDFGMLVLITATLCNFCAWLLFSIVLGGSEGTPLATVAFLTIAFAAFMLTAGRYLADKLLSWVQAELSWPSGVLGFMLIAGLLGAAVTDALGVHAIFGAFLTGIALGDSPQMREQTRHVVHRFVEGVLAPIFVAAIGLEVNFAMNFQPMLVVSVVVLGISVKLFAGWLGARLASRDPAEAWAIGWALSARGELGIVIGLLAWQGGVIRERLFVAIVSLAVVTSALAGPMLKRLLKKQAKRSLGAMLDSRSCLSKMAAENATEVLRQLCTIAADRTKLDLSTIESAVLERERMKGTGLGNGIAVPNARLPELTSPHVFVGTLQNGVDFAGVDDEPVRLVFLILTPASDPASQLEILSAIGNFSHKANMVREAKEARTPLELAGVFNVADSLLRS